MRRSDFFPAAITTAIWVWSLGAALADPTPTPVAWQFPLARSTLAPVVVYEGRPTRLMPDAASSDQIGWSVEQDGRQVARLTATGARSERLDMTLAATAAGHFQYTLWLDLPQARPLDGKDARLATGLTSFHYPYDWERSYAIHGRRDRDGQAVANTAPIELIVPGFETGGRFYAVDTWKLTKLSFRISDAGSAVGIDKTGEVNQGYDGVSPELVLAAGASTTLSLLAAPTLERLSVLRFGTPRPVTGRMTFLYNKGWACAETRCGITPADYEMFASRVAGTFDLVIVRSYDPAPEIAKAFTAHSIDPYYYMFLGAERRSDGAHFRHDDWILHDTNGAQYGAPIVSPTASWGLLDIRRADVRAALVARATSVLAMGYRGVFFDGPAFWLASDGHVGGAAPGATMSWAFARSLLLRETRAAMTAINARSRVGVLGDRFYDAQALADFCLKESYGENWISIDPNPDARSLRNATTINQAWDRHYRPFITNSLFIGQKGSNPVFVEAGWRWGAAGKSLYTEIGDAYPLDGGFHLPLDRMGRLLHDASTYATDEGGLRLRALDPPDAAIVTAGPSVIAAKQPATLTFDTATPILSIATKTVAIATTARTSPGSPVIVAERRREAWHWTGYGFAYRDLDTYLYGDVLMDEAPTGSTRDRIVLHLATSPGPLSRKPISVAPNPFAARTVVFHAPPPRALVMTGADGGRIDAKLQSAGPGEFMLTLPAEPRFGTFVLVLDYAR